MCLIKLKPWEDSDVLGNFGDSFGDFPQWVQKNIFKLIRSRFGKRDRDSRKLIQTTMKKFPAFRRSTIRSAFGKLFVKDIILVAPAGSYIHTLIGAVYIIFGGHREGTT